MQSTVKIVEEPNKPQDSPVHRVEVIELVEIRRREKGKIAQNQQIAQRNVICEMGFPA